MTRLNAAGVKQVASFIERNHKQGMMVHHHYIRSQVLSINSLISEGKEPTACIEYSDSITGCEVQFTVPPDGLLKGGET